MQAKNPVGLFLSIFYIPFFFYDPFWFFHKKLPFDKFCFDKLLLQLTHTVKILKRREGFFIGNILLLTSFRVTCKQPLG